MVSEIYLYSTKRGELKRLFLVARGLSTLPFLALKLILHGLPDDTPVAAIERGTTAQQHIVFMPLNDLANEIALQQLVSPSLIMIGRKRESYIV